MADCEHPVIHASAGELTENKQTDLEKSERIFRSVRDGIKFGFPPTWNEVKASEALALGMGACNIKVSGSLFGL